MVRLEVIEKYPIGKEIDEDYYTNLKLDIPKREYGYRRTMPIVDNIERPIEIPGNKKECIIRFWSGEDMVVLEDYDSFCIKLHDIEERMLIEHQLIQNEIFNANQSG